MLLHLLYKKDGKWWSSFCLRRNQNHYPEIHQLKILLQAYICRGIFVETRKDLAMLKSAKMLKRNLRRKQESMSYNSTAASPDLARNPIWLRRPNKEKLHDYFLSSRRFGEKLAKERLSTDVILHADYLKIRAVTVWTG